MKCGNGRKVSGKQKANHGLSGVERRRLTQFVVSLALFAAAMIGRSVFPERMEYWNEVLCRDIDFQSVFSDFGETVLQGDALWDGIEELCVDVFAGGATQINGPSPVFEDPTPFLERCRTWQQTQGNILR